MEHAHASDCGCSPCEVIDAVSARLAADTLLAKLQTLKVDITALVEVVRRSPASLYEELVDFGRAVIALLGGPSEPDVDQWDELLADVKGL